MTPGARRPLEQQQRQTSTTRGHLSVLTHIATFHTTSRTRPYAEMANNDPSERRILPQGSQMNSFSFAPSAYQQPPQETQQRSEFFSPLTKKDEWETWQTSGHRKRTFVSCLRASNACECMREGHARGPGETRCSGFGSTYLTILSLTDYVFVDEHNRHKRLKGKGTSTKYLRDRLESTRRS